MAPLARYNHNVPNEREERGQLLESIIRKQEKAKAEAAGEVSQHSFPSQCFDTLCWMKNSTHEPHLNLPPLNF